MNSRHPEAPANYEGILSRACHSLEEVETTVSLFNYVLMSPVYDSISKQGYRSGYSKDELKQAQESGVIHEKVVALGGISEVNLAGNKVSWLWRCSFIRRYLEPLPYVERCRRVACSFQEAEKDCVDSY